MVASAVSSPKSPSLSSSNPPNNSFLSDPKELSRCRYKTGKCTNTRSLKRDGKYHQLCKDHRDRANKIQRKFDRQKRKIARVNKIKHPAGFVGFSPAQAFIASTFPPPQASLDMYSDCESSRKSSDSMLSTNSTARMSLDSRMSMESRMSMDSNDAFVMDDMWINTPSNPIQSASSSPATPDERLSVDELDFLCSAILQ